MLITGQLSEYSLPLLVEILTRNGETGVLVLEHPEAGGSLHFVNGKLSSAIVGALTGPEAISYADKLEGATFRFERLSLAQISQKLWSEALAAPSEELLRSPSPQRETAGQQAQVEFDSVASPPVLPPQKTANYWFWITLVTAFILMSALVGLSRRPAVGTGRKVGATPTPAVTDPGTAKAPPNLGAIDDQRPMTDAAQLNPTPIHQVGGPAVEEVRQAESGGARPPADTSPVLVEQAATPDRSGPPLLPAQPVATPHSHAEQSEAGRGPQTITVVLRIENGQVIEAYVLSHRPGLAAYEATALRTVRQRRYPASFSGQETVSVQVEQPH